MSRDLTSMHVGQVLEEDVEMTLAELCRVCHLSAERLYDLVEQGVIEPIDGDPAGWRFQGICVRRVRCALRLQRDLGVNLAGAALALDLLDELEALRIRLARLSS